MKKSDMMRIGKMTLHSQEPLYSTHKLNHCKFYRMFIGKISLSQQPVAFGYDIEYSTWDIESAT